MRVEACTNCKRQKFIRTHCDCCKGPLCNGCAHVEAGAIWCGDCLDEAYWYVTSTNLTQSGESVVLEALEF